MIDTEYAEYKCSACKKEIKSLVVQCRACIKLFFHPSCVIKHKIYNRGNELVKCAGPFDEFSIGIDKVEINKKTPTASKNGRDRLGSTGSTGSTSNTLGSVKSSGVDVKIDWLVNTVKEVRDEMTCKKEIKAMIKEIIREETGDIKQELEELRSMIRGGVCGLTGGVQRSYSEVTKEKKKENIIIVKPKVQQESEVTKKMIKEKVDIKNMDMGITKLKKGSKGAVILGCETGEERDKLKATMQDRLGENFNVTESRRSKPKIKIVGIGEEEMNLNDNDLIVAIKKQNKMEEKKEGIHMQIVKRITKEKKIDGSQAGRRRREEGTVIIEADEETHAVILGKGKLNIGWKKCPVFNHINVKRCFKCWEYYHIARNCTRDEACYRCAGSHRANECTSTEKKCINCAIKIKTYNLKISDEHDATDPECPTFKKMIQEEKRRAGWEDSK
ncbi:uncharacterized protein [Temnothorax nylanderi]|uniref:uncharacterized protein n=1 Tax=Temnothorax nylanderi TaxID=102681 RepID=UPI003A8A1C20